MIDVNKGNTKKVLEEIHNQMLKISGRGNMHKEEFIAENRLFSIVCHKLNLEPRVYALEMNDRYGYDFTGDDIIRIFKGRRLTNQPERKALFRQAEEFAEHFAGVLALNPESIEKFEKLKNGLKSNKKHASQERIISIMIFEKYPEIDIFGDAERLMSLGDAFSKYFFYDMADVLSNMCIVKKTNGEKRKELKMSREELVKAYEDGARQIARLESTLERTNAMFQDLQDEFEEQLEMSKVKELTDFFAKLNSEKYGCILDELLVVRKGIDELRKNNYELPIEINGLLIMVKKLIQFIRDSHIEPAMKINSIIDVTASDVEFCNYEGTAFSSADEVKKVKVVSPGWIYKDKEIRISRPKVKEEY